MALYKFTYLLTYLLTTVNYGSLLVQSDLILTDFQQHLCQRWLHSSSALWVSSLN